jgi:hypothetical protein
MVSPVDVAGDSKNFPSPVAIGGTVPPDFWTCFIFELDFWTCLNRKASFHCLSTDNAVKSKCRRLVCFVFMDGSRLCLLRKAIKLS